MTTMTAIQLTPMEETVVENRYFILEGLDNTCDTYVLENGILYYESAEGTKIRSSFRTVENLIECCSSVMEVCEQNYKVVREIIK